MKLKTNKVIKFLSRFVRQDIFLIFQKTTLNYFAAAWLAQLVGYQTAVREVEGSSPGRTNTQGLKNYLRRKCFLCYDICNRVDFLVFSDKDDKP